MTISPYRTAPLIATIGFGAMARSLARSLRGSASGLRIAGCLLPPDSFSQIEPDMLRWKKVDELVAACPDLVVECATHAAVRDILPQVLEAGIDVIIISAGALGDENTTARLEEAAQRGGARARIAPGAIGGLDVLRAARIAGLDRVVYTGRKPPAAWKGSLAEHLVVLNSLEGPTVIYEGSAAEAARDYPKNTNVSAAVSLAGVGFARTTVRLIADPGITENIHEIDAEGAFGRFTTRIANHALPDNPRTSWLAALSVEQEILRHFSNLEL